MNGYLWTFTGLWIFRYLRLLVSIVAYYTLQPIPIPSKPSFWPNDCTVIIPTTASDTASLIETLLSVANNSPSEIIIVTASSKVAAVRAWCMANLVEVKVIEVEKLNKRNQMVSALRHVETDLVVFADDDVIWPGEFLKYLIAPFEDPSVGAAGPAQRLRRSANPNIWHFLGTAYLERRNFNTGATNSIDGGISTLSGRTSSYRTCILQNNNFYTAFTNDTWRSKRLNSDDDKALTRWVFSHDWKIHLQVVDSATLQTSLEEGRKFIDQCMRWARAHWRGNFVVMSNNDYWCR